MKRRGARRWIGAAAILIVLVAAVTLARQQVRRSSSRTMETQVGAPPAAPRVSIGHLTQAEIPATLSLSATIISLRQTSLFSKVAGYLEAVTVRPGDLVRAGQIVAVVEHSQLDAQVAQAAQAAAASREGVDTAQAGATAAQAQIVNAQGARQRADADLANARAALKNTQAQLGVADAAYTRASSLFHDGLVSQQDLDNATAQLQSAQAAVRAAQAQIGDGEAEIQQADAQVRATQAQAAAAASQVQTQRAQTSSLDASLQGAELTQAGSTIRAPWAGIVIGRSLDPGAYVTPGAATPILAIADLDRIAVQVNVAEADMALVKRGAPAAIGLDAFPGRVFHGLVTRIAGGVDPDTRTVQVEIDVNNSDHALLPGMYARVGLTGAPRRAAVVPVASVVHIGDQTYVYVVENGRASRRAVTIGATTAAVAEITDGVTPDEAIVIRGADQIREDGPVRIISAKE